MAEPVSSHEVLSWPEFIAFAKRLGIDVDKPILELTINLQHRNTAVVEEIYYGIDDKETREEFDGEEHSRTEM